MGQNVRSVEADKDVIMGSPSVQNQKVVEAWTTPLFVDNEHALNHLRIIYCNIYTTRKKRFRLGTYNTDQITIDTNSYLLDLRGFTFIISKNQIKKKL